MNNNFSEMHIATLWLSVQTLGQAVIFSGPETKKKREKKTKKKKQIKIIPMQENQMIIQFIMVPMHLS